MFKTVCFRAPGATVLPADAAADYLAVANMTNSFKSNGYRLKRVFDEAAVHCKGE